MGHDLIIESKDNTLAENEGEKRQLSMFRHKIYKVKREEETTKLFDYGKHKCSLIFNTLLSCLNKKVTREFRVFVPFKFL